MTAKEMFKCMDYVQVKQQKDKELIIYEKVITDYACIDEDDENYNTWQKCSYRRYIAFDTKRKEVDVYSQTYDHKEEYPCSLNMLEIMAIQEQMGELGWIE